MLRCYFPKICIACAFISVISIAARTNAQEVTIVYREAVNYSETVTTIFHEDVRFISVNELARVLNAHIVNNDLNRKSLIQLDGKAIKVTAFNPFIQVDDQTFQLPIDTILRNSEIYLPFKYALEILGVAVPNRFEYDESSNTLILQRSMNYNVEDIEVDAKINGTLIRIKTIRDFKSSDISLRASQGWLYVDLYGGRADSASLYKTFSSGLIVRIIASQISPDLLQIGFRLRDELVEKHIISQNPREIMVSLKTKKDLSAEITKDLENEKSKWLIDKIVIDPGHGGKDPGAVGRKYRTYEKDVVLGIARHLKELLVSQLGIDVLMTREDDRFIELYQRTEFANRNQAKLFISIHANSVENNSRVRGVSTYFLGPGKSEEARQVARLENSVIKYENESKYADLTQENFILSSMAQNIYNLESQDLAEMVQKEITQECGLKDRGVIQAEFYVLWKASMPNILIETAYISNANEENLLRSNAFQKKQAMAIFRSIKKFKEKYESEL
ncbi:MAG: N-acetylmuramoyl-L-alanine amidase [Candidatus Zhuqueibacterota bacterium]